MSRTKSVLTGAALLTLLVLVACGSKRVQQSASAPPPIYSGPAIFHGTVGSMAKLDGMTPLLVSNYGLVSGLQGTGSADVPEALRQRLVNEMRRRGFGSFRLGTQQVTPDRFLQSMDTAVVRVEGLVPPGATRGTRFDVLVTALPQTQTTSLEAGRLYTTELSPQGTNLQFGYSRPYANAVGTMYLNPFESDASRERRKELSRQAVILSGGVVTADRTVRLVLNQPNWTRSVMIADRINERFRKGLDDRNATAVAQDDSFIDLHIPTRFRGQPDRFFGLIQHLYLQRHEHFEVNQARLLAQEIERDAQAAPRVALAWESLGKMVLEVIREYYDHPRLELRLAALQAGARLEDQQTAAPLEKLALHADPTVRKYAADAMVYVTNNTRIRAALTRLLNDSDRRVRLAAYHALDDDEDAAELFLHRTVIRDSQKQLKFVLDIVDVQLPLVYITQTELPRVVIFNPHTGFNLPMVATLWDNRLMIKTGSENDLAEVYYQHPGAVEGKVVQIRPAAGNLVVLLGRERDAHHDLEGLGLTYSQVVNALYQLKAMGFLRADLELEQSSLATMIAQSVGDGPAFERPESGPVEPIEPVTADERPE